MCGCRVEGAVLPAPMARRRMEGRGLAGGGGRRALLELLGGSARSRSPRSRLPWPGAQRSQRRGLDRGRRKRISTEGSEWRAGATVTLRIWPKEQPVRLGVRLGFFFKKKLGACGGVRP